MLQIFCHAPGFDETHQGPDRAGWLSRPNVSWSSTIAVVLRTIWDALCEGIAAHRQYEHLRSKRVPHGTAIRQALGVLHPQRAAGDQSPRHHHRSTSDAYEL